MNHFHLSPKLRPLLAAPCSCHAPQAVRIGTLANGRGAYKCGNCRKPYPIRRAITPGVKRALRHVDYNAVNGKMNGKNLGQGQNFNRRNNA